MAELRLPQRAPENTGYPQLYESVGLLFADLATTYSRHERRDFAGEEAHGSWSCFFTTRRPTGILHLAETQEGVDSPVQAGHRLNYLQYEGRRRLFGKLVLTPSESDESFLPPEAWADELIADIRDSHQLARLALITAGPTGLRVTQTEVLAS